MKGKRQILGGLKQKIEVKRAMRGSNKRHAGYIECMIPGVGNNVRITNCDAVDRRMQPSKHSRILVISTVPRVLPKEESDKIIEGIKSGTIKIGKRMT